MTERDALATIKTALSTSNETDLLEAISTLESAIGLLEDFKLWYSLDPVTKLRGRNKLTYLADYYAKLHTADTE